MSAVELGQTLHISDITFPKGVEPVLHLSHGPDHDLPIVSINKPKAAPVEDDTAPEAPESENGSASEE